MCIYIRNKNKNYIFLNYRAKNKFYVKKMWSKYKSNAKN